MSPRLIRPGRKTVDTSKLKKKHVRVVCPHCGKTVKIGKISRFQRAMPCPSCRVPIDAEIILAAEQAEEEEQDESGQG